MSPDEIDLAGVGRRLSATRRALNLSQDGLASKMHVSREEVGAWEAGEAMPDVESLLELFEFDVFSLDWIFLGDLCSVPRYLRWKLRAAELGLAVVV